LSTNYFHPRFILMQFLRISARELYFHGQTPLLTYWIETYGSNSFKLCKWNLKKYQMPPLFNIVLGKLDVVFINFASILEKQSHGCEKFHEWMCIIMKLIETSELTIWRVMKRSAAFPKDSFRFQPWINLNPNMINIMQM